MTPARDIQRWNLAAASDADLWQRIQKSDADAFAELYRRHLRAVLGFCLRRTAEPALADDLSSTVFLETWRKRERLALTTDSARPLLMGIATNLLRHHWRARRRHADALLRLRGAAERLPGAEEDDETIARLDAQEALRGARQVLDTLPRRELEVLSLVAWADLTYEETAAALRIPVGTVRSRLARARKRIKSAAPQPQPAPTAGPAATSAKGIDR